jgi:hypothetical protein
MDTKHKACEIKTWKTISTLRHLSLRCSGASKAASAATSALNCFTWQTLPNAHRRHPFMALGTYAHKRTVRCPSVVRSQSTVIISTTGTSAWISPCTSATLPAIVLHRQPIASITSVLLPCVTQWLSLTNIACKITVCWIWHRITAQADTTHNNCQHRLGKQRHLPELSAPPSGLPLKHVVASFWTIHCSR